MATRDSRDLNESHGLDAQNTLTDGRYREKTTHIHGGEWPIFVYPIGGGKDEFIALGSTDELLELEDWL